MADLFTRLVSGPASAAWLSPRVPALHEPNVSSDVDEVEVAERFAQPAALMTYEMSKPEPVVAEAAVGGRPIAEAVPAPMSVPKPVSVPMPVAVTRVEPAVRELDGPADADRLDLGGLWSPQQPQSSKISPEPRPREAAIRPREPEAPPTPPSVPTRQAAAPEPARTTVRIEIGRIEIRAPQQPLPIPAAPRNQGPEGLTLADYLRGNDGRPR